MNQIPKRKYLNDLERDIVDIFLTVGGDLSRNDVHEHLIHRGLNHSEGVIRGALNKLESERIIIRAGEYRGPQRVYWRLA